MAPTEVKMNIRDYGVPDSNNFLRAVCNYCDKNVSNFSRLKAHLGGVGTDVTQCLKVDRDVKEYFRNELLGRKQKKEGVARCRRTNSMQKKTMVKAQRYPLEESASAVGGVWPDMDLFKVNSTALTGIEAGLLGLEQREISVPNMHNLRGSLLQREINRMQLRSKKIQSSWKATGCSVIVDGWTDVKGRNLLNVLVDCPCGPNFIKSLDISAAFGDDDALLMVFDEIIEEVGADNVVQVISSYLSPHMKAVGERFMENHPTIFWTVSASHCLELLIEKMGTMESIKCTLNKARTLTKFIYSHIKVLELMRSFTTSRDLIKSTKMRSIMPFTTLENIVSEKENIEKTFSSSQWNSSGWASSSEGRRIVKLVGDASFWSGADEVLKAIIPLVRALHLLHESAEPQLGFIYETMDQAKEKIKENFGKQYPQYGPYWDAIDDMWNNCLHSPLHSVALALNPIFHYSAGFSTDTEVNNDLHSSICNMVEERKTERLIYKQVALFGEGYGLFGREDAIQLSSSISPVRWWSMFGKECPELQSLAIRILSQTCDGASRYDLDRSLAERLFMEERDEIEQQQLKDFTYCQYNLQLEGFVKSQRNRNREIETLEEDDEPNWTDFIGEFGASTSGFAPGEGTSGSARGM